MAGLMISAFVMRRFYKQPINMDKVWDEVVNTLQVGGLEVEGVTKEEAAVSSADATVEVATSVKDLEAGSKKAAIKDSELDNMSAKGSD